MSGKVLKPKGSLVTVKDGTKLFVVSKKDVEKAGALVAMVKSEGKDTKKGEQATEANVFTVVTAKTSKGQPQRSYKLTRNDRGVYKEYDPDKKKKDPAAPEKKKKRAKPTGEKKTKTKTKTAKKKLKLDKYSPEQLAQIMAIVNAIK